MSSLEFRKGLYLEVVLVSCKFQSSAYCQKLQSLHTLGKSLNCSGNKDKWYSFSFLNCIKRRCFIPIVVVGYMESQPTVLFHSKDFVWNMA